MTKDESRQPKQATFRIETRRLELLQIEYIKQARKVLHAWVIKELKSGEIFEEATVTSDQNGLIDLQPQITIVSGIGDMHPLSEIAILVSQGHTIQCSLIDADFILGKESITIKFYLPFLKDFPKSQKILRGILDDQIFYARAAMDKLTPKVI